ncbi:MAG: ADP-ribosylglycohydrolase family protein [Planctomycetota bacterium]
MKARANSAVTGALVADAASLGLHWIYDPERLAEVGGNKPEFLEPDIRHYKGTTAYFAHRDKHAGDSTHYGEQLKVLLRSLQACDQRLAVSDYERRFVESFGPGGTFVGYIDFATRETLRLIDQAERDALTAAHAFDLGEHESDRALMEAKVMANVRRWNDEKLDQAMAKAVRITHGENEDLIAVVQEMARAVKRARTGFHGADDVQLPALSKLPALAAAVLDPGEREAAVEHAVRVTNDNDEAVAHGHAMAHALWAALDGASPREAADAAANGAPAAVRDLYTQALAFGGTASDAAAHFGRACPLPESAPVILVHMRDATDFESAVRSNILAGGDSAGRAIVLGAVLGAAFGVPADWAARLA